MALMIQILHEAAGAYAAVERALHGGGRRGLLHLHLLLLLLLLPEVVVLLLLHVVGPLELRDRLQHVLLLLPHALLLKQRLNLRIPSLKLHAVLPLQDLLQHLLLHYVLLLHVQPRLLLHRVLKVRRPHRKPERASSPLGRRE